MSIVVWTGTEIAADRQSTNAEMRGETSKLKRLDSGIVAAWTGDEAGGLAMLRWFVGGQRAEEWPRAQETDRWVRLIVARADGIQVYEQYQVPLERTIDPFAAWGSGRDFAIGALAMGATASKAVEIASRYNIYCGGGVDVETLT